MVYVNLFYSDLALINVGIIAGIWNILPLFVSIVDFCIYGQRLETHHMIGVFSLVLSALCISLAGINDNTSFKYDLKEPLVKPWIPVLLGVLTPCFFATQVIFVKHLSGEESRIKFDSTTLTFSTCGVVCAINIIIAATWYWQNV